MDKSVSSFKGKLRQIKLKIDDKKAIIQIYDIDINPNQILLLEQKDIDFSEIKSLPLSHKISIKNYWFFQIKILHVFTFET